MSNMVVMSEVPPRLGSRARPGAMPAESSFSRALVPALALLVVACGGDDESPAPSPDPAPAEPEVSEAPAAPAPDPDEVEAEPAEPAEAVEPSLQIVGADRTNLLFLDTGSAEWTVERVPSAPVNALHAVTWMGCGDRAGARSVREIGVWQRDGTLAGQRAMPNLVRLLGDRIAPQLAEYEDSYDVRPEPDQIIGVGALLRAEDGALRMRPTWSMEAFNAEMGGCVGPADESLTVDLPIDGVEPRACAPAGEESVSLTHALEEAPPVGFECAYLWADDLENADPSWLEPSVASILRALPDDCSEEERPDDAFEAFRMCTRAAESGGLTLCKHDGDPRIFAAVLEADSMGCETGPQLFVLRGESIVANAGPGSELRVMAGGRVWIYGGRRAWFIDGPGRRPVRFGRARPDVVLGTR